MAENAGIPAPEGLKRGGLALWASLAVEGRPEAHLVLLTEACRAKDRLDQLDLLLGGEVNTWMTLTHRLQTEDYELVISSALREANTTAGVLRQLLAQIPVEAGVEKTEGVNPLDELEARRAGRPAGTARPSRTNR
jgi:hypothetical protein